MTSMLLEQTPSQEGWRGDTVLFMAPPRQPYVPMNDLARLIFRRKEELGLSWYDIRDRGPFPSHTIPYALATKREHKQPPRALTLQRLAKALEIDLDLVRAAAASAAGYDMSQGTPTTLEVAEDLRVIAQAMGQMSETDRAKVRKIALSFLPDSRESLDSDRPRRQTAASKAAESAQLRAELSEAADKVPGPQNVRSISAKRPSRGKKD